MRLVGHNLLSYQISGHWVIFPPKAKNEDGYILYQTSSWGLNWNTPLLACPECFRTNVRRQTPSVWVGLKLIHGEIPKWCTLERARTSRMTRWYNPAVSILTWRILFNFPVVRVAGISRRWMIHQLVLNVWRQAQAVCSRNTAGSEISQRAGRGVQQASPGVYAVFSKRAEHGSTFHSLSSRFVSYLYCLYANLLDRQYSELWFFYERSPETFKKYEFSWTIPIIDRVKNNARARRWAERVHSDFVTAVYIICPHVAHLSYRARDCPCWICAEKSFESVDIFLIKRLSCRNSWQRQYVRPGGRSGFQKKRRRLVSRFAAHVITHILWLRLSLRWALSLLGDRERSCSTRSALLQRHADFLKKMSTGIRFDTLHDGMDDFLSHRSSLSCCIFTIKENFSLW